MACAACLSSAAGCAAHRLSNAALAAIVAALPRCTTCRERGRDRHATRTRAVQLSRWYLCDEHGEHAADLPYAGALRAAGLGVAP